MKRFIRNTTLLLVAIIALHSCFKDTVSYTRFNLAVYDQVDSEAAFSHAEELDSYAFYADTTEWYILVGDMHYHIVDTTSARGGVAQDVPAVGLTTKVVEGQRLLAAGDVAHHLALLLEGEDGEHGTEDLLGEHGLGTSLLVGIAIRETDVGVEQRGLDEALGGIGAATIEDVALGEVALDTLEGTVVDHTYIVLALGDIVAVELDPKTTLASRADGETQFKATFCENEAFGFKILF